MTALPLADEWLTLDHGEPLSVRAVDSPIASEASVPFDYTPAERIEFRPFARPDGLPDGLGVIVGGSGTGKSTLLRTFGDPAEPEWSDGPIAGDFASGDLARECLYAVGLSSVPTWWKPYRVLSQGERFRADLARALADGAPVVDEFTSVVDRTVAQSASKSLRRYMDANGGRALALATCHRDVLPWLRPDWIIDTDAGAYCIDPKECLQRAPLVVSVYEVDRACWDIFSPHHYLGDNLHPFARCYLATVGEHAVSFGSAIPFPHGAIEGGWRGTRTVTLPDFQGFGIGVRLSDWIAEAHVRAGYRYFSRTTHPRMGEWRERHAGWRATSSNRKRQKPTPNKALGERFGADATRVAYSHEFVMDNEQRGVA